VYPFVEVRREGDKVPRVSKKALSEAGRLLVQGAINIGAAGGKARAAALSQNAAGRQRMKEIARLGGLARAKKARANKKTKAA
jgi:hypothetical protein